MSTFRNNDVERHMRALARTLSELRRSLHIEFASRAAFGAVSPCAAFEQTASGRRRKDPASGILAPSQVMVRKLVAG